MPERRYTGAIVPFRTADEFTNDLLTSAYGPDLYGALEEERRRQAEAAALAQSPSATSESALKGLESLVADLPGALSKPETGEKAAAVAKGVGKGSVFWAGAEAMQPVAGMVDPYLLAGPQAAVSWATIPAVHAVAGLMGGYGATKLAETAGEQAAKHSETVGALATLANRQPEYEQAGELATFGAGALKGGYNLLRHGGIVAAEKGTAEAAKQVGKIVGSGAAAGTVFEGVIRPATDWTINRAKEAVGMKPEDVLPPTAESLLTNAALGAFMPGLAIKFKGYSTADVTDIVRRAHEADQAGQPLTDTLSSSEIDVLMHVGKKLAERRASGQDLIADPAAFDISVRQSMFGGERAAGPEATARAYKELEANRTPLQRQLLEAAGANPRTPIEELLPNVKSEDLPLYEQALKLARARAAPGATPEVIAAEARRMAIAGEHQQATELPGTIGATASEITGLGRPAQAPGAPGARAAQPILPPEPPAGAPPVPPRQFQGGNMAQPERAAGARATALRAQGYDVVPAPHPTVPGMFTVIQRPVQPPVAAAPPQVAPPVVPQPAAPAAPMPPIPELPPIKSAIELIQSASAALEPETPPAATPTTVATTPSTPAAAATPPVAPPEMTVPTTMALPPRTPVTSSTKRPISPKSAQKTAETTVPTAISRASKAAFQVEKMRPDGGLDVHPFDSEEAAKTFAFTEPATTMSVRKKVEDGWTTVLGHAAIQRGPKAPPEPRIRKLLPFESPHLADPKMREILTGLSTQGGWAEHGGHLIRGAGGGSEDAFRGTIGIPGDVIGLTKWVPHHPWWAKLQRSAGLPNNSEGKATQLTVEKALAGAPMSVAQRRHMEWLVAYVRADLLGLDDFNAETADEAARAAVPDLPDDEPISNLEDVALTAKAVELVGEDEVDRIASKFGNDDAGYLAEIKKVIYEAEPQATRPGGEAVPPAETAPATAATAGQVAPPLELTAPTAADLKREEAQAAAPPVPKPEEFQLATQTRTDEQVAADLRREATARQESLLTPSGEVRKPEAAKAPTQEAAPKPDLGHPVQGPGESLPRQIAEREPESLREQARQKREVAKRRPNQQIKDKLNREADELEEKARKWDEALKAKEPDTGRVEQTAPKYEAAPATNLPAFRRWFGSSKVVDDAGLPKKMYFGGPHDLEELSATDRPQGGRAPGTLHSQGVWLTANIGEGGASDYAMNAGLGGKNPAVYPVYASIKNPAHIAWQDIFRDKISRDDLIKQGYDGAYLIDTGGWVAFHSTQIKSAIGNRGTFDETKASMVEQPAPEYNADADRALLDRKGIAVVKKQVGARTVWEVSGKTYDIKDKLKAKGASFYGPSKAWTFWGDMDPTAAVAQILREQGGERPGVAAQPGGDERSDELAAVRAIRERESLRGSRRGSPDVLAGNVSTGTRELLERGLKANIPADVIQGQVEDVGAIVKAYTDGEPMFLLANSAGAGKAQPLDAKILTPSGWKDMGEMHFGQEVIAGDGSVTRVTGIYPQGEKDIYRVTFNDGSFTECCNEHLWLTHNAKSRSASKRWGHVQSGQMKPRQLSELRDNLRVRDGRLNYSIPMSGVVEMHRRPVDVPAYTMGVLLGDGNWTHSNISFTQGDDSVAKLVAADLLELDGVELRQAVVFGGRAPTWRIGSTVALKRREVTHPVRLALKRYGLDRCQAYDKFVPDDYKFNSADVRLAMLQGLMDTDGYVEKRGMCTRFTSTSKRLADDVTFLVRSLGGTTTVSEKMPWYSHNGERRTGRKAFTLGIKLPNEINPFRLARKRDALRPKSKYGPVRYITAVEHVGRKHAQCITVAHPSRLYVTDDLIVTHNTFLLGGAIRELRSQGQSKFIYVTMNKDLIEQIQKDLADYGIGDVEFRTYADLSLGKRAVDAKNAVLIFDEVHNVKNQESARGEKGMQLMDVADYTVFSSATPFENPAQVQYLEPTGIFEPFGGFERWAQAFGATLEVHKFKNPYTGNIDEDRRIVWRRHKAMKQDSKAGRDWFENKGVLVARAIKLDPKLVTTNFTKLNVDQKWVDLYGTVGKAYDEAQDAVSDDKKLAGEIKRHRMSMVKRILEAGKVKQAIEKAQAALTDGKRVVIFTETKADRELGVWRKSQFASKDDTRYTYPQMLAIMAEWRMQAEMAKAAGDRPPPKPFAPFIMEIARTFHTTGIRESLPSVADEIQDALGGPDKVGMYTGAVSNGAARADKNRFMEDKVKVLIATMAKGGTGLSLHDTVGNRPTVSINLNLPWTATSVEQVSGRTARYGLRSPTSVDWLFAGNIPWESETLAPRIGARMASMGALVKGVEIKAAEKLALDFNFEGTEDVTGVTELKQPEASYSAAPAPVFYSGLQRSIGELMAPQEPVPVLQNKITGWLNAGKLKKEELEWSGLREWLAEQQGKVTRDQVLDFLRANEIKVEDVLKGGEGLPELQREINDLTVKLDAKGYSIFHDDNDQTVIGVTRRSDGQHFLLEGNLVTGENDMPAQELPEEILDMLERAAELSHTEAYPETDADLAQYSQWQLPGAKPGSYRELLLTLPGSKPHPQIARFRELNRRTDLTPTEEAEYNKLGREIYPNGLPRPGEDLVTRETTGFQSSHFDVPNILAHIRFNERTDADGKRVLFIEEIQSDWAKSNRRAIDEITKPDSVRVLAENVFGRKLAAMMPLYQMDGGVLAALKNEKVRRAVVASLPVEVVDDFKRKEFSPEKFFSDPDVVVSLLPSDHLRAVAHGVLAGARGVGARLRAKLLDARESGRDEQLLPTLKTSELDTRVVVGLLAPDRIYHAGLHRNAALGDVTPSGAELLSTPSDVAGRGAQFLTAVAAAEEGGGAVTGVGAKSLGGGAARANAELRSATLASLVQWHVGILRKAGASLPARYIPAPLVGGGNTPAIFAFKRALRWAVDHGYDRVAWTTGEQQADRYDLSKQVKVVEVVKQHDGKLGVSGVAVNSDTPFDMGIHEQDGLADIVGKDLAEKITRDFSSGTERKRYTGLELKVGGEGMKGFYDDILPKEVGKYVKKWGAKVGQTTIAVDKPELIKDFSDVRARPGVDEEPPFVIESLGPDGVWHKIDTAYSDTEARRRVAEAKGGVATVHSLDITDAMKESVRAGQTLFQKQTPYMPRIEQPSGWKAWPDLAALYDEFDSKGTIDGQQATMDDLVEAADKIDLPPAVGRAIDKYRRTTEISRTQHGSRLLEGDPGEAVEDAIKKAVGAGQAQLDFSYEPEVEPPREPGAPSVPAPTATLKPRYVALGIAEQLQKGKAISLVGQMIDSPRKLAELGQILRDPLKETFRYFFVKAGVIVHATSLSSGLPDASNLFPNDIAPQEGVKWLKDSMQDVGADGYYVMHNHPSGDPDPSDADRLSTRWLASNVPGFLGHVIIDSNKFASLSSTGDGDVHPADFGQDKLLEPAVPHAILGRPIMSAADVAAAGIQIKRPGWVVVVGTTGKVGVRAAMDVPAEQFADHDEQKAVLAAFVRATGSGRVFVYGESAVLEAAGMPYLIENGYVFDAVQSETNRSYQASGHIPPSSSTVHLGERPVLKYVEQEQSRYNGVPPDDTPAAFPWEDPRFVKRFMDDFERILVDDFNRVRDAQQYVKDALGLDIAEPADVSDKQQQFPGKVREDMIALKEKFERPLADAIGKAGTLELFDYFVRARHAQEGNDYIDSLYAPWLEPQLQAELFDKFGHDKMLRLHERAVALQGRGTGMSNAEATGGIPGKWQGLDNLAPAERAKLDAAAKILDDMLAYRRQRMVESGLMKQADINKWEAQYQFYVPVKSVDPDGVMGLGQGFALRGRESPERMGRTSAPGSPTLNALRDTMGTVIRAQKAAVDEAMYHLVKEYPVPHLWHIATEAEFTKQSIVTGPDGTRTVQVTQDPSFRNRIGSEIFPIKYKGTQYYVVVSDPTLVRQFMNMGESDVGGVFKQALQFARMVTSTMGQLITSWSPEWMVTNHARDLETALINIHATEGVDTRKAAINIFKGLPTAYQTIAAHVSGKPVFGKPSAENAAAYKEFLGEGGATGFYGIDDIQTLARRLEWEFGLKLSDKRRPIRASIDKVMRGIFKTGEVVRGANEVVENATRFSVFKELTRQGLSAQKAAVVAKNITINFNLHGEAGPVLNALYMFFNASMQGSRVLVNAAKNRKVQKALVAMIAMGYIIEMLNYLLGGEDKDAGTKNIDEITDWTRDHYMIFKWSPDSEPFKLVLPYGYNIFYVIGRRFAAMQMGRQTPGEMAIGVGKAMADAFNPFGGVDAKDFATWMVKTIAPTPLDPITEVAFNDNYMGGPVHFEDKFAKVQPPAHLGGLKTTSPALTAATEGLSKIGVEINPADFEHYIKGYFGGVGALLLSGTNLAVAGPKGDITSQDIPFLRKMYGASTKSFVPRRFYEIEQELVPMLEKAKGGDVPKEKGAAEMIGYYQQADREIGGLRRRLSQMRKGGAPDDAIKGVIEQIDRTQARTIRRYNEWKHPGWYKQDTLGMNVDQAKSYFALTGMPATAELLAALPPDEGYRA